MPILDADKEINTRYFSYVDGIIISRIRIIAIMGTALYLSFNLLDWVTYPTHATFFFKIRYICVIPVDVILFLSFWKRTKPLAVWFADAIGIIAAAGIALMIFLSDGSSSHYYEGLNLAFLSVGIMNSSYPKHNIFTFPVIITFYELAALNSRAVFNEVNFCSANFFMISTAFLVILMTKLYSTQHQQAYFRQEQLDQLSKTDELTKIHNRRSFFDILQNKMESSDNSNAFFYLIIFDVDHFKDLNDRWGHSFGDIVLSKIVDIVKSNTRTNDCLGRFGGDEFIVFLDIADTGMLMQRLKKISQEVASVKLIQQKQAVPISISIGAAKFIPRQNMTKDQLIEKADQQLLLVKKTGRGQIRIAG